MKEPGDPNVLNKVAEDAADYVTLKIAAFKLALTEGLSRFFGNAVRIIVFIFLCGVALMAFAVAGVYWIGELIGSLPWAAVIVGGVCLVAAIVIFRAKTIFVNPMVGMFSDMIFSLHRKPTDKQQEEDEQS